MVAGPAIASYVKNLKTSAFDLKTKIFDAARDHEQTRYDAILTMQGDENPYKLHDELAAVMLRDCTIERNNAVLDQVLLKLDDLEDRYDRIGVPDTGHRANQSAQFVRHLKNMIVIARVIAQGARIRDESRGAHYKQDFPQRDDPRWLKTTLAFFAERAVRFESGFTYPLLGKTIKVTDEVDISLVKPRVRRYESAGAASAGAATDGPRSAKPKVTTPPAE
jgi:succinate dehydrogenase / fumarate reductase flavoprotein subunit